MTGASYPTIGKWVNRNHATMILNIRVAKARMQRQQEFARTVAWVEAACRALGEPKSHAA
jgi:hypothetical protein